MPGLTEEQVAYLNTAREAGGGDLAYQSLELEQAGPGLLSHKAIGLKNKACIHYMYLLTNCILILGSEYIIKYTNKRTFK